MKASTVKEVYERIGRLKQKGCHSDWREIVRVMNTQSALPPVLKIVKTK